MKPVWNIIFLTSIIFGYCHGGNILFIYNIPLYSHYVIGKSLAQELAWRGHEVTMISGIEDNDHFENLRNIYLDGIVESINGTLEQLTMKDLLTMPTPSIYIHRSTYGYLANNFSFAHKNFQQHLKENNKYDLIIMDYYFTDSLKTLCHHYNTQCVFISSTGSVPSVKYLAGNPISPSSEPEMFAYSDTITLLQRVKNVCYHSIMSLTRALFFIPKHQELIDMHFPKSPNIYQLFTNTSITFLNSQFGVTEPGVRVPNLLEIDGVHIKYCILNEETLLTKHRPLEKLNKVLTNEIPGDILSFLDAAENGVIYFSLGANLRSADLPLEIKKCLLEVFGNLNQRVLWKYEDDGFEELPNNIVLTKWVPQVDILAHSNVKAFITHGGLLSLTEAIHFGVPVIGIPFGGDQEIYLTELERLQLGIKMEFDDLNVENLLHAIADILVNTRYTSNMKKRSEMFRDRPLSVMDTAMYWIEYVIRYKDVMHLESTSAKLILYQYYMIDDILFVLASMFVVTFISFALIKHLSDCQSLIHTFLFAFVILLIVVVWKLLTNDQLILYSR